VFQVALHRVTAAVRCLLLVLTVIGEPVIQLDLAAVSQVGEAPRDRQSGIGPTVGYNIPLSSKLSLWPRVGVWASDETITNESNEAVLWLNGDLRVLYHPAPHFFVGFGPYVQQVVAGNEKETLYGASFTIGGWVGP